MLILLRLAEDVITFQTLPTQRRRDIQQTLTQNMDNIFSFMMAILHLNVEDYRKLVSVVLSSAIFFSPFVEKATLELSYIFHNFVIIF